MVVVFTGICGVSLFIFEILFVKLRKSAGKRIKIKTHMVVGGLSVLMVLLHCIATGFHFHFGLAFWAFTLFLLTALSGVLIKYIKHKEARNIHIVLSVVTLLVICVHAIEEIVIRYV